MQVEFEEIGRLASSEDNVAIATRVLEAGTTIAMSETALRLSHTVLEGHRFAIQPISAGDHLLSWGQPFGTATTDIGPGEYVCNQAALDELNRRTLDFTVPATPNFADTIPPFIFDETIFAPAPPFVPAPALSRYDETTTFMGYRRPAGRGVGIRNIIVLLGTTSMTAGFVRTLESQLRSLADDYPNIDAIVAVAHTEGGHPQPNNRDLLLRTLAGFMAHPNVGAALVVDYGTEAVTNAMLRNYMEVHDYPLSHVSHEFMTLSGTFERNLEAAADTVRGWLDPVNAIPRTPEPLSTLKIALQCGGSDAFSGISGNPLVAWVAREILRHGGAANLAETDELIGAESFVLKKVRDTDTARKFLATLDRFQERAGWHGHSAFGNPSGGNVYRGLYNIYLKSLGAAAKRHPDVRLDYVIDYAEPMRETGFHFMDSPGNDLESIAGQVASGCNLIFFVTGNGSVTNFPFVPTIKVVTTTERYQMLADDMDLNAGKYLDGAPLEVLGQLALKLAVDVASGQRTAGERAGHAQVQLWRNWQQTGVVDLASIPTAQPDGKPLPIDVDIPVPDMQFTAFRAGDGYAADQIGLILPTSLCSGQIARLCVEQLNESKLGQDKGLSRFVELAHTEGCGASTGAELDDTLLGYLLHPLVRYGLLLEHGCEKTHNSYMRQLMGEKGIDPSQFGWASVQMDGGIQAVMQKMIAWFSDQIATSDETETATVGLAAVRLGLVTAGDVADDLARQLAHITRMIVAAGGTVVVPENDALLKRAAYRQELAAQWQPAPTIGYAQRMITPGFHIMATPSDHWTETLTGLGATGVQAVLGHVDGRPMPAHPFIPMIQVTANGATAKKYGADLDGILSDQRVDWSRQLLELVISVLSRRYTPRLSYFGDTNFQIARGQFGVSL